MLSSPYHDTPGPQGDSLLVGLVNVEVNQGF